MKNQSTFLFVPFIITLGCQFTHTMEQRAAQVSKNPCLKSSRLSGMHNNLSDTQLENLVVRLLGKTIYNRKIIKQQLKNKELSCQEATRQIQQGITSFRKILHAPHAEHFNLFNITDTKQIYQFAKILVEEKIVNKQHIKMDLYKSNKKNSYYCLLHSMRHPIK